MKKHKRRIQHLLLFLFICLFLIIELGPLHHYITLNKIQEIVTSVGLYGPVIIILLQAFQTSISIIPSQITTIIAGFLFGPFLGLLYSLIGATLGSSATFFVGKKEGSKIAEWFLNQEEITHFTHLVQKKKKWAVLLARLAPIFPNDLVSFGAGLTRINFWQFTLYSTIGFVGQMIILTYLGAGISEGKVSIFLIIISIITSLLFLVLLFKRKIKQKIIKGLHSIEKEEKDIEKKVAKLWK